MRIAALLFVVLSVVGCSKAEFSYDFTENGCKTGKQEFDSKEAMCSALQSDSRNNSCALGMRENKFRQDGCSGTFSRGN